MAYVISDECIACGTCIDECPSGAISEGEKYSIDPNVCVDCGTCADVCPRVQSLQVNNLACIRTLNSTRLLLSGSPDCSSFF